MFVNLNDMSVDVAASSTPTAYKLPGPCLRVRIVNDSGDNLILKAEESSVVTLVAPTTGVTYQGTHMINGAIEIFDINPKTTHVSIYSPTGTGTVSIQSHNAE